MLSKIWLDSCKRHDLKGLSDEMRKKASSYYLILRYKELERARVIFQRFVMCHPEVQNWIRWAKFEQKNGFILKVRLAIFCCFEA